jgi:predicted transcriptional regulator
MNELLNVISASDKRRNLLILLNSSGPQEWDDVKRILNVTSTGMLPQIKILEEEHLIERDGRRFSLTPMGKVLTTHMEPLIKTMEIFDKNRKFWGEHNIGVLPLEILLHIGELGNYQIVENPDVEIFDVNTFLKNISTSKVLKGISHTVHPRYPSFFLSLAKKGVETSLILTPGVYQVIKEKYRNLLEEWLECKNAHLYVPPDDIKFSFVVTDTYFSISLFYTSGVFDSKNDVVSFDPSAQKWGERIFSYYQKQSKKIESLD